jgi:hypothetical protein
MTSSNNQQIVLDCESLCTTPGVLAMFRQHMENGINKRQIPSSQINSIMMKIEKMIRTCGIELYTEKHVMRLNKIEFTNFLGYKGTHVIDFTDFKSTIGVMGKTNSGKTSLLDIIYFAINNDTLRGDLIDCTYRSTLFLQTKIWISNDVRTLRIERTCTRQSCFDKSTNDIVDFYDISKGEETYLNNFRKTMKEVNKWIKHSLCNGDSFQIGAMYQQYRKSFFDFPHREKLFAMLRLDIFECLPQLVDFAKKSDKINKKLQTLLEEFSKNIKEMVPDLKLDGMSQEDIATILTEFATHSFKLPNDKMLTMVKDMYNRYELLNTDAADYKLIHYMTTDTKYNITDRVITTIAIPFLESTVNDLAQGIYGTNFSIHYRKGQMHVTNNGISLDMCGASIQTLFHIVYRAAIMQISRKQFKFLILDEPYGNCSYDDKMLLLGVINNLRTQYDWIMVISRDTKVQENLHSVIQVSQHKENGRNCSKLNILRTD